MRVLFFGSGSPASLIALRKLLPVSEVGGVVVPNAGSASALAGFARKQRLRTYIFNSRRQETLAEDVTRDGDRPELLCVASFPSILKPALLSLPTRGGINLHWSVLPKHRGPDPLFWTYLCDDRMTGVTVHWLDERVDAGDMLLQREIALTRGRPLIDLYGELAAMGSELLAEAITLIGQGRAPRLPQSEVLATQEPSRDTGTWRIDLERWPAERVWHVVRGLTGNSASLLGSSIVHGPARECVIQSHGRSTGTIEEITNGWRVFCFDGYVDIERPRRTGGGWLRRVIGSLRGGR